MTKTPSATKNRQDEVPVEDLLKRLVLTGADIVRIGEDAELLVGGKNYNTALISRVEGVRIPQFRAISSVAFHIVLDECKVCALPTLCLRWCAGSSIWLPSASWVWCIPTS